MATLSGLFWRLIAIGFLTLALAALSYNPARAESADTSAQSSTSADTSAKPADAHSEAAHPAAADAPAPATAMPARSDSAASAKPQTSTGAAGALKADSSEKSASQASDASDSDEDSQTPGAGAYAIHTALKSFDTEGTPADSTFDHASGLFPAFCKDWQRRLHDRELNNEENISWKDQNGWKTGTYLAYSPVKSCSCKRSTGGVPIGELTYQETEYYLAGRTVEEARHSQPKPVGITNTTEIFRWDKNKWDDGR